MENFETELCLSIESLSQSRGWGIPKDLSQEKCYTKCSQNLFWCLNELVFKETYFASFALRVLFAQKEYKVVVLIPRFFNNFDGYTCHFV